MKETKFTATMTFNTDKELVQDLRNEFDIGEKQLMSFIIHTALQHRSEIEARVVDYKAELQKVKDVKKAELEQVKAEARAAREQARATKKAEREAKKAEVLEVAARKARSNLTNKKAN
jgi:hypothetical protein